jgi:hypothetical protein
MNNQNHDENQVNRMIDKLQLLTPQESLGEHVIIEDNLK